MTLSFVIFVMCHDFVGKPFGKRAADGRNGGSDSGKGLSERGKAGADGGYREGDCHTENGVLMVAIATIGRKNFSLLW